MVIFRTEILDEKNIVHYKYINSSNKITVVVRSHYILYGLDRTELSIFVCCERQTSESESLNRSSTLLVT